MKKKKRSGGIEALRRRYGYAFVSHWIVGLILFFFIPLFYSIAYAFSEMVVSGGDGTADVILKFVGLSNFVDPKSGILTANPDYVDQLAGSVGAMFYSLPMIVALSLILAVLLNQKYHGRGIMRVIFFLPVIIESSVIVRLLSSGSINAPIFNMSTEGSGVFDYATILSNLNLPPELSQYFTFFLSNAVTLTWSCGIQIVLFLAGLQGIPESLYEVSKIEGANKWEEFWMITVPMLRHVLSLVIVYTMISMFTSANNKIMSNSIELMRVTDYGQASAMLWFYFIIVLAIIGIVLFFYNKFCIKKWE
ncbi:MAG: sugar ABC transporter permease [Clostridia bacterium]|nr:sugar ABC transporter permease [Clostridia bacterium]